MRTLTLTADNGAALVGEAAGILLAGGVVVMPTDTVYGLAAHPSRTEAVARLGTLKGRPTGKPIALLAADLAAVRAFGARLSPVAQRLAQAFWPGGLTLVLPCGGTEEGFRVPDHPLCRELLTACGGLLRVTSANLSGALPAVDAAQTLADVGLAADLVLDAGPASAGLASTVVRVTDEALTILRPGVLDESAIRTAAGG
jgi:L-threonylcarbamoyladenylate synthase